MTIRYISVILTFLFIQATVQLSAQSKTDYVVITNDMGQYAVWAVDMETPEGWKKTDMTGNLSRCTKEIKRVWTDMRPLSIQEEYDKGAPYSVIINHEEQYLIWPTRKEMREGWETVVTGTYDACERYIDRAWTDMRPLSLRKKQGKL